MRQAMNTKTRATLLERLRDADDPLAWDEFFARYGRLAFALARHRGCSEHTAEEIVQDAMLALFERRDVFRYDPAQGRFRDWIAGMIRHKVAEFRRRPAQRVRAVGGSDAGPLAEPIDRHGGSDKAVEDVFEEALLAVLLDVVRREMNPRTYQAFELFVLHELPGAKAAQITGLTRNAVYQARKEVFRRLVQLGASYRDEGQLDQRIKAALQARPPAAVERSLSTRVGEKLKAES